MKYFKTALSLFAIATVFSACNDCDKTQSALNDLTKAKALLQSGLANPSSWQTLCSKLMQSSEVFSSESDYLRHHADENANLSTGCLERKAIESCTGGWVRRPYHASILTPRAAKHSAWDWWYEPRICRSVEACLKPMPGRKLRPSYDQTMALAYEFDQIAGGIEMSCRNVELGMPAGEINSSAREALDRIENHATKSALNIMTALACENRKGH